jgi:dUTP pyrophosphatase
MLSTPLKLEIKRLHADAQVERAHESDAGLDLFLIKDTLVQVNSATGEPAQLETGIAVNIPFGYVGLLFERSSGWRFRTNLRNKVGVIDAGYTGPLVFQGYPDSEVRFGYILPGGTKLAQLVIIPCIVPELEWVDEFSPTARGAKGLGSTGIGTKK